MFISISMYRFVCPLSDDPHIWKYPLISLLNVNPTILVNLFSWFFQITIPANLKVNAEPHKVYVQFFFQEIQTTVSPTKLARLFQKSLPWCQPESTSPRMIACVLPGNWGLFSRDIFSPRIWAAFSGWMLWSAA